jgi:hypothetical protein
MAFRNAATTRDTMPSDQHQQLLACFDPVGLERYGITADELRSIERYIRILQSGLGETVWDEAIQIGGAYGTSILIHEITEIRTLYNSSGLIHTAMPKQNWRVYWRIIC